MKVITPKLKLIRLAAAASLGCLIGTGCATGPTTRYSAEPTRTPMAGIDRQVLLHAPLNLNNRRPDTHPYLRSGLWDYTFTFNHAYGQPYTVIESPGVDLDVPPGYVDTPSMLVFNPEVINVAVAMQREPIGQVIRDAAGAPIEDQPAIVGQLEDYERELAAKAERHVSETRRAPMGEAPEQQESPEQQQTPMR